MKHLPTYPERWTWQDAHHLHWHLDSFLMDAIQRRMPMTDSWGVALAELHIFLETTHETLDSGREQCRYLVFLSALTAKGVVIEENPQAIVNKGI